MGVILPNPRRVGHQPNVWAESAITEVSGRHRGASSIKDHVQRVPGPLHHGRAHGSGDVSCPFNVLDGRDRRLFCSFGCAEWSESSTFTDRRASETSGAVVRRCSHENRSRHREVPACPCVPLDWPCTRNRLRLRRSDRVRGQVQVPPRTPDPGPLAPSCVGRRRWVLIGPGRVAIRRKRAEVGVRVVLARHRGGAEGPL